MVRTFDDLMDITRITIHGGMDYMEEKASPFNFGGSGHGHPICTIEIGDTVRHFKCTSITPAHTRKRPETKAHFYELMDRDTCQLDKTFTAVRNPHKKSVIDFNHSVYIVNDETPPMPVYPRGNTNDEQEQTSFEVSERDKVGILNHVLKMEACFGKIKKPSVSEASCIHADRKWLSHHPHHHPHPIQVVDNSDLELELNDLEFSQNTAHYLFE